MKLMSKPCMITALVISMIAGTSWAERGKLNRSGGKSGIERPERAANREAPGRMSVSTEDKPGGDDMKQELKGKIDPEQQTNLNKLAADLKGIQENSEVTEDQKKKLQDDLKSTLSGARKPSQESVDKLVADLAEYTADGKLTHQEALAIHKNVNAVLNSANISDEQIETLKSDVQAIAEASNLSKSEVQTLVSHVVAVAQTAKKNAQEIERPSREAIRSRF